MKNYLLPTAIFGSITVGTLQSIALVSYISPAMALSPIEVQRIAKQTTVRIAGCNIGSGVILRKNGNTYTVLTVAHAVKNTGCEIVTPDDAKYRVTQVKNFPNKIDLAVVTFTSNKNYAVAKIIDNSDRIEAAENIYVSGFPLSSAINSAVFTFVKGDVIANPTTQQQGKGYSLIYSNNTLPGHSGGPVWNDRGEVIAIHGQGDILGTKLTETINRDVRVKTGYNLGITTNTFAKLASTAGIAGYTPTTVATRSKPVDDLIASAIVKESKGDYKGMLADMDRAIFLDSQNGRLYYTRGVAKSLLGNRDAIADYNQAIAFAPNESAAYNNRGVTKSDLGDKKGAIVDFDRAIALDANDAKPYYNRGNAKAQLNSPKTALVDFDKAIALDPNLAPAYLSRGTTKSLLGDTKGELADFNKAIALDPNYTAAHYNLGLAKSTSGDKKGAIESFNRAIALNPKDAEPYSDRGNAKSELGDNKGAIEDYNRSIVLDPNNAKAYANRGLVKSKLGDKKGAILDLKKAANRFQRQRQTASYRRTIAEIQRIGS
ncbi:tetratricopeptide repeat-containing serine protease family protein [Chamaesiphon sp. VAR_69_metabat_338]|uniref:tetratricopeptide repeat-containing serine protease family protein n=1 Tax=Chamaesiphon sp. VAR_69_metabat_338 TaxID=2964704 RepID=UPI00286E928F|nr:tetratricopeptide repeat-containing serine protease family protein [Chamaesiphon sp. VAR_69_metabat_338]